MEELISIIVPVYNAQNYLDRSIQSIINQSYQNLELLLIDDGSTDNSLAICRKYEAMDPRVKVFTKQNGGVSSARNFGFSKMKGTWFMTMDSDDYMAEDAIRILYESVKETGADIAVWNLSTKTERQKTEEPGKISGPAHWRNLETNCWSRYLICRSFIIRTINCTGQTGAYVMMKRCPLTKISGFLSGC